MLLNSINDEFVDLLLVLLPVLRRFVFLLLLTEDITLFLLGALVAFPLEVLVVNVRRQFEAREIDLRRGGDNVILVYPPQWATVDEEWACKGKSKVSPKLFLKFMLNSARCNRLTSDKEKSTLELSEQHDALSLVWSSEDDANCALGESGPQVTTVLLEALFGVVNGDWVGCWVVCTLLLQ